MFLRFLSVLIISLLFIDSSFSQNDSQAVLKSIQNKFNSIDDLSADLTQSVNGKVNLKGKVFFKKENHLRFEFKNILIISDGETSWNYNEKENKVIISNYEDEGSKILSIRQIIFEYPENCELKTFESSNKKFLQLIPKDDVFSFNSIQLSFDKDYLITQALIDDPATGSIQIDLSNYRINKNLPDSLFKFSPPEESQIIDLR